jgi:hypothetical protein
MRAEAQASDFSVRIERHGGVESHLREFAAEFHDFQALDANGLRVGDGFESACLLDEAGPAFREFPRGEGGSHAIVERRFHFRKFAGDELVNDFLRGLASGDGVAGLVRRRLRLRGRWGLSTSGKAGKKKNEREKNRFHEQNLSVAAMKFSRLRCSTSRSFIAWKL